MSIEKSIKKIWYPADNGRSLPSAALLLSPLALLYRNVASLRNNLYDRHILKTHRLPCPVVSIGNITVGGTGKTPAVITIAEMLAESGLRPAILSRGYGGASKAPVNIVSDGKSLLMKPRDAGDEPVLMALKLPGIPVLTGPQRHMTGKAAIEIFGVDVLVLDDAFQHRQIHRDTNILLIDGGKLFGNGFTLPAGPLREPVTAVRRADIIIMTGTGEQRSEKRLDLRQSLMNLIPDHVKIFEGRHKPLNLLQKESGKIVPLDCIRGKRICAFAGIASPEAFRETLQAAGGMITSFLPYPDHHRYTQKDICDINDAARRGQAEMTISTEKDGVKLDAFPELMGHVFLLRITMAISSGQDDFKASILAGIDTWKKRRRHP